MSAAPLAVTLVAMEPKMTFEREVPQAVQELKLSVVAINPDSPPTDILGMERYGVKVFLMSHVGHFLMMEDPERFNCLLRAAVDTIIR